MKSMTGYGRGEWSQQGFKVTVELSAVNRKQGEVTVLLPRTLEVLEAQVRDLLNQRISRGRITARISLHASSGGGAGPFRLNSELAKAYLRELRRLARELKLEENLTLHDLVNAPGVLEGAEQMADAGDLWPAVERALKQALDGLVKMRLREGEHLAADLSRRMAAIQKAAEQVRKRAPLVQKRYREQLIEKIKAAGLEAPGADDERLLKEVIYFADRSDITEEITRLQSHFKQFQDCLKSREAVGRTLDFLAQEMNREINTIGSKANDALISRQVVVMKAEMEKFREQAQNVE